MFGSQIIDVGIGLVLIYCFLSIASSSVTEQISQFLRLRSENLWDSVCSLLNDRKGTGLAAQVFNHRLVRGLAVAQKGPQDGEDDFAHPADDAMPSYIPSDVFAEALLDTLVQMSDLPPGPVTCDQLSRAKFPNNVSESVVKTLKGMMLTAQNDPVLVKAAIADWYDATMARSSGWYKRKVQNILFCISLGLVVVANADSFMISNELWASPQVRNSVLAEASATAKTTAAASVQTPDTRQLFGWTQCKTEYCSAAEKVHAFPPISQPGSILLKIFGLLATAYAASLGSSFWFKVLQQGLSMRNMITGKEVAK